MFNGFTEGGYLYFEWMPRTEKELEAKYIRFSERERFFIIVNLLLEDTTHRNSSEKEKSFLLNKLETLR